MPTPYRVSKRAIVLIEELGKLLFFNSLTLYIVQCEP